MRKQNIYFYSTSTYYGPVEYQKRQLYVNAVPFYLNSYLKHNRPDLFNSVVWTKIQLLEISKNELIKELNELDIDILCVSVYIWNQDHIFKLLTELKKHITKKITIVAGGPSIDPHRNKKFFNNGTDIDYAVYAQGETAFASIIDNLVNNKPISLLDAKNIAWNDPKTNTIRVADYEFIRLKDASPYIDSEDLIKQIINLYPDKDYFLPYETSKGCPYNCSFCDWTSGLSHKVTHRHVSIDDELELLAKYKLTNIHMSDANFGQHKQDIILAEKMAYLRTEKNIPFIIPNSNFSKLRKKEVFYIAELFIKSGIMKYPKFAFEDIHDEVLDNIDRPCIPWREHLTLIKELRNKYPDIRYNIELIYGLPGQTRKSWEDTIIAFDGFTVAAYPWMLLPNSPAAYDIQYKDRMKIKTSLMYPLFKNSYSKVPLICETYSYKFDDYIYITALAHLLHYRSLVFLDRKKLIDRAKRSERFQLVLKEIEKHYGVGNNQIAIQQAVYALADELYAAYDDWPLAEVEMHDKLIGKTVS